MKDLAGKVAVVTGGASGIGYAMAERFLAEGMSVMIADVEEPALKEAVASLTETAASSDGRTAKPHPRLPGSLAMSESGKMSKI